MSNADELKQLLAEPPTTRRITNAERLDELKQLVAQALCRGQYAHCTTAELVDRLAEIGALANKLT